MSSENGTVFKDPRVDRAVTWGLAAFCGLALTVGAWFFKSLTGQIDGLAQAVTGLKVQVAVNAELKDRILGLEAEIDRRFERLEEKLDGKQDKK